MKSISIFFVLCALGSHAFAVASSKIIVGSFANNTLLQGRLAESTGYFDIAISGSGFLPLKSLNGEIVYTRQGSLGMDKDGDLEHVPSGLKVVIPEEDGQFNIIHLERHATRPFFNQRDRLATLISMGFSTEGSLDAYYSDQQTVSIAKLKLATFENQRKLKVLSEKTYLLKATKSVGEIAYIYPGDYPVGQIYGHHLESISMSDYKKALK